MSEMQKKSSFPCVGWDELVKMVNAKVEHLSLSNAAAKEVITAFVEATVELLGDDHRVRIKGLGTLTPRLYGGHTMNTPNVGEEGRVIKKQRVIRFNQSRVASVAINEKPLPGEKKAKKAKKAAEPEEAPKKAKKAKAEVEAPAEEAPKKIKKAKEAPAEEAPVKKAKKAAAEPEEAPKKAKKAKAAEVEDEDEE